MTSEGYEEKKFLLNFLHETFFWETSKQLPFNTQKNAQYTNVRKIQCIVLIFVLQSQS